ncbi:hypothetical protein RND81_03G189500 [Saponaria officinalis]|uniref:Protein TIC 20 n=1 Tax=Saponaria officinalis TaxID=3572 RepID=A0AAW1M9J9_SAPOF
MQGVIAKSFTFQPLSFTPRVRGPIVDRLEVPTNLPFPLKNTLQRIKLIDQDRNFRVHAVATPFMSMTRTYNSVNNNSGNQPEKRRIHIPNASKYPPETEKPKWWLRSLAGLPYLLPFIDQLSWTLAHPSNPNVFLESFDNFTFPLISTFLSLPRFLLATYSILLYFWIVRRKEWPHFLRFHVMMGILLGTLVQTIGVSGNWLPTWAFPPHFWSVATFLFLVSILECIRCALAGKYAGVPFVKDAAFMHSDLNLR